MQSLALEHTICDFKINSLTTPFFASLIFDKVIVKPSAIQNVEQSSMSKWKPETKVKKIMTTVLET